MKNTHRPHLNALVVALTSAGLATIPQGAHANPTGGNVVAGNATIQQESPTKLGITQTSERAIIEWPQYSIGANEHVQYYQPSASAVSLNRVTGQDPSQILGRLTANGQVYLVNSNGIFFGKNAQIDVAGLVATTHDLRNADFMAGRRDFTIPGKPDAAVINEGSIRIADTGIAAFVAPSVANRGLIAAKLGKVTLAAAHGFTLDFTGDDLLSFMVGEEVAKTAFDLDGTPLTSFVDNAGRIEADGGRVLMTAKAAENAIHGVINHSGIIQATTVEQRAGEIILHAGKGSLKVSGTLDASAPRGGDGGFVETSGGSVNLASGAKITTAAPRGVTGTWLIDPRDFTIAASGGNMTGASLSSQLASSNVIIETATMGSLGGQGDIFVNDNVAWASANILSLQAERNITIDRAINGTHPDSVFYSIGQLRISGTGSVRAGAVRYDVMDGIDLVGPTTAGKIYINSGAIRIELSDSGAAAASITPSEIATLNVTRTGVTERNVQLTAPWGTTSLWTDEGGLYFDAPFGITVDAALTSSHINAKRFTLFSWIGGDSFVSINAPINLSGNLWGGIGDFKAEANTLTIGASGRVTADSVEYLANRMNLYGTTTASELWKGPYGGPSSLAANTTPNEIPKEYVHTDSVGQLIEVAVEDDGLIALSGGISAKTVTPITETSTGQPDIPQGVITGSSAVGLFINTIDTQTLSGAASLLPSGAIQMGSSVVDAMSIIEYLLVGNYAGAVSNGANIAAAKVIPLLGTLSTAATTGEYLATKLDAALTRQSYRAVVGLLGAGSPGRLGLPSFTTVQAEEALRSGGSFGGLAALGEIQDMVRDGLLAKDDLPGADDAFSLTPKGAFMIYGALVPPRKSGLFGLWGKPTYDGVQHDQALLADLQKALMPR